MTYVLMTLIFNIQNFEATELFGNTEDEQRQHVEKELVNENIGFDMPVVG